MPNKPEIALQLYTLSERLEADFDDTVRAVADIGFKHVELFLFTDDTERVARTLRAHGLDAPSGHELLLGEEQWPARDHDKVFGAANEIGISTVIDNSRRREDWRTEEGIRGLAEKLNEVAKKAKKHGVRVGSHNHHWEVEHDFNGRAGLEVLASHLDPEVVLEIDTYWVAAGGQSVPELLTRLGDRVRLLHMKDGPIQTNFDDQVPLGQGKLPVREILASATSAEWAVIEFDAFKGDMLTAVHESYDYLAGLLNEG